MSYRERRDTAPPDCKVYVGNLGSGASRNELEKEFSYFGRLSNVWVARNPPGFAYIEFEDSRDAKDACRELDGRMLCGRRAKVELSHGKPRQRSSRPVYFGGHPPRRSLEDLRCYQCGGRGHMARNCSRRSRSRSRSPRRRSQSRSRSRSRKDSRSRSRKDSRSKSRSRSPSRKRDSRSRSRSRDPSESPEPKSNGRRCESRSRSRSRSPDE